MDRYKTEELRIIATYVERDTEGKPELYSWSRGDVAYSEYRINATWARALARAGFTDLANLEILDVGCGSGSWLRKIVEWGAIPSRLYGIDLLEDRIAKAQALSPSGVDFRVGSGWPLPYETSSMDLCVASTVFSSILDAEARLALAREMERVVRPQGWLMILDYAISDPRNPNTTGIGRREIQRLFPALQLAHIYRFILAPPLLRRLPGCLLWVALCLETFIPFSCTHRLYLLRK
jgi:SAM-dependent methyltransferase